MALLGFSGAFSAHEAQAESPPTPAARFAGSVTVDGAAVAAGTLIEARIGNTTCGTTRTFSSGAEARYVVDIDALDPGKTPNCGADGAVVTFYIGGKLARETGSWKNYQLNTLNLTYVTPTPTPTAPGGGTTTVPKPPTTGSGLASDETSLLLVILGAALLAASATGAVVARKRD
jgi:hypothetical protein